MVWEMHGDEDMRTGGLEERRSRGEKDRVFQHSTAHSTLPELPGSVGAGISSAAACTRDRHSQCCCRGGRTGVLGSAGTGVLADGPWQCHGDKRLQHDHLCWAGATECCWDGWLWWGTGTGLVLQELCGMWGWCCSRWAWSLCSGWMLPGWDGMEVGAEGMVALGFGVCGHHGWYDVG